MTRIPYIVIVVKSLERSLAVYEHGLGFYRLHEPCAVPSMGAWHVLLRAENCVLELLEPHDDEKPAAAFLRERGEGVFAMAVRVEAPEIALERLRSSGVELVGGGDEAAEGPLHWWVRPSDAAGIVLDVGGMDVVDPI
jgi:catechol 2,3-dioxygenase-like lactoylglutathione lyase family enzyme